MQKILLVDDEHLILYSLAKALRHDGNEVTAVTNGREALAAVQREAYDMCFLDVQLPDANGLKLMEEIRNLSPAVRIVIMTADALTDEQHRRLSALGGLYLPKPFEADDAQAIVQSRWGRSPAAAP